MQTKITVLTLALAIVAAPAMAANADQPYQNIDKSNDAGNSTGNFQVDPLNRSQLDENQRTPPPGTVTTEPGPLITLPPNSVATVPPGTVVTVTPGAPPR